MCAELGPGALRLTGTPGPEVLRRQVTNQLRRDIGRALKVDEIVVAVERPLDVPLVELVRKPDGVPRTQELTRKVEA